MGTMKNENPPFSPNDFKSEEWRTNDTSVNKTHGAKNGVKRAADDMPSSIKSMVEYGRDLPAKLEQQMKTRPNVVLAGIGGASFVLGAFFGTKLGRIAMVAAVGYGINRLIAGDVGREVGKYLKTTLEKELS